MHTIMSIYYSQRVEAIKPSPTLAVTARANALKAEGKDIISLGAGEPDFPTPEHIKAAAVVAIHKNMTRYTAVDGTQELKQVIIDKFQRDNNLRYNHKQVIASTGGKQVIFNLALAMLDPGCEVIIPAPYWVSYPDIVKIADAKPVVIATDRAQQFKITPQQLEQAITDNTRLLFLNSPSNPSGVAYTRAELVQLAEVLLRHPQVYIATDDIYEHILWSKEPFCNMVMACPELYARTIVINGVSKAYSMTGWRIGYAGGPEPIITRMKKVQSQSTSNACSISQAAATEALNGDQSFIQHMTTEFKKRHDYVVAALNTMDGINCSSSDGAFYSFPEVRPLMQRLGIDHDVQLAEYILEQAEVAVVPGSAFGLDGYIRLSFATSMQNLEQAMSRLQKIF